MFSCFSGSLSTFLRQEVKLAKAEVTQSAKEAGTGTGTGMFVGAAVGGFFGLPFLSMALMWALTSVRHLGWVAVIATVLAFMGKKQFEKMKGLPQTQETVGVIL